MTLQFTKMQGIGNDYVYLNCMEQVPECPEKLSVMLSDRHFEIGSDGLVLILPSQVADFQMRMFNADGSEGKMCGNASRCVAKYVYDRGLTDQQTITLETKSGIKRIKMNIQDGKVCGAQVSMGQAILNPREIPVLSEEETFMKKPLEVDGKTYSVTCVSMGNPHAVVFCDEIHHLNLEQIGPGFEHYPLFPDRINTEFVHVLSETEVEMRVWERGSGETLACGTGACATAVACVLNGFSKRDVPITVHLKGGDLEIVYQTDGTVLMSGPASHVFDGTIEVELDR